MKETMSIEEMKKRYITLLRETDRKGIDDLIDWLENETDFFTAPASTKYHNAFEGGLLDHSLNVFDNLLDEDYEHSDDTLTIVSLLHDICKANFYSVGEKNIKKDGEWIKEPYYMVEDQFPLGHGEKSVILIQRFIKLSDEEIAAIRWHMGGYEPKDNYGYLGKAFNKYSLAVYLHIADLKATYLDENIYKENE